MNPHSYAAHSSYPPGSGAAGYEERLSDNEYARGGNNRGRGYSVNDNGYDHQVFILCVISVYNAVISSLYVYIG